MNILQKHYGRLNLLGEGGNGAVFNIRGQNKVIKVSRNKKSLKKEYDVLKYIRALGHKFVPEVYKFYDVEKDMVWFEMNKVKGDSLYNFLYEHPDSINKVYKILKDYLGKLKSMEIIHGDLKGDNIIVNIEGGAIKIMLIDFGRSLSPHSTTVNQSKIKENLIFNHRGTRITLPYIYPENGELPYMLNNEALNQLKKNYSIKTPLPVKSSLTGRSLSRHSTTVIQSKRRKNQIFNHRGTRVTPENGELPYMLNNEVKKNYSIKTPLLVKSSLTGRNYCKNKENKIKLYNQYLLYSNRYMSDIKSMSKWWKRLVYTKRNINRVKRQKNTMNNTLSIIKREINQLEKNCNNHQKNGRIRLSPIRRSN